LPRTLLRELTELPRYVSSNFGEGMGRDKRKRGTEGREGRGKERMDGTRLSLDGN